MLQDSALALRDSGIGLLCEVLLLFFGGVAGGGFGFSQMFQEKEEGFDFIEYQ
jgi:hypothetical protein